MSVTRRRDPAGLMPDVVTVSGAIVPGTPEWDALTEIMEASEPDNRITALRRHDALVERADRLSAQYEHAGQRADRALLLAIAQAELHALRLDAAPSVIRDIARQEGTRGQRRVDIDDWIIGQLKIDKAAKAPELYADAPDWITDRIAFRTFAKRVTDCRLGRRTGSAGKKKKKKNTRK